MVMLDTNMILRYMLNDDEEMAEEAERIINEEFALVTIEVVAESIYVMKSVYNMDKQDICRSINILLDLGSSNEMLVLREGIDAYSKYNLDFIDCILHGYHRIKGYDIASFDKRLNKLLQGT